MLKQSLNLVDKYNLPYSEDDINFVKHHVDKVLTKGYLTDGGEYVSMFEHQWSNYVGVDHSIAVNSCTTGLELALKVFGVAGHSVIVPNYTFCATPISVINAGGSVLYADIDTNTLSLSVDSIKECIRPDTKAVVVVHVAGIVTPEIDQIKEFCKESNLYLIEDAACAHGASVHMKNAGTFGDISVFSFHHSKVLTSGEGGMICTDNSDWALRLKRLRSFGIDRSISNWEVLEVGGSNYKMSEITAILGILHTRNADDLINDRRRIAKYYDDNITNNRVNKININGKSSYYKYVLYVDRKTMIRNDFLKGGVDLPPNVYDYLCSELSIDALNRFGFFPGCVYAKAHNLCLPMYNGLKENELDYVVDLVNAV
jgi:perosamine synthetase